MSAPRFIRDPEVALGFHVLAHMPLGRDAASLFDETLPPRPWVEGLTRAYADAPGRLMVHWLALRGVGDGLEPPASLSDDTGRTLLGRWLDACASEREAFMEQWEASATSARARLAEVGAEVREPLSRLRAALWEQHGTAPPLTVLDGPALGLAGRGGTFDGERRVAVNLAAPVEHVLCQVLHEEVHPVTDPVIRQGYAGAAQDTRAGSPGHAIHAALEEAAVEVGEALIAARTPRWTEAYGRWRARLGV